MLTKYISRIKEHTLDPCRPRTSHSPLVIAISSLTGHLKSPEDKHNHNSALYTRIQANETMKNSILNSFFQKVNTEKFEVMSGVMKMFWN